eukprot:TRINITY_DN4999_c0_g1_i1.p1 TRINITY_DN4999_c0_g1~~TRINITY_DN4999_c0_g1_i1.p1  ORF type:complete len:265 (-),score=15.04 TRINITY_DN4999_c0_g1_i1:26-820(-)
MSDRGTGSILTNLLSFVKRSLPSLGTYTAAYMALDKGKMVEALFPVLNGSPNDIRIEWISRVLSNCNAVFMVLGVVRLLKRDTRLRRDLVYYDSPEALGLSASFFGYVVYDLALCLSNSCLRDPSIVFHHFLFLALVSMSNTFNRFAGYGSWLTLNEISTVFLNQRWFFMAIESLTKEERSSKVVMGNQLLFVVTFFVFRVVLNTIITKNVITTMQKQKDNKNKVETRTLKLIAYLFFPLLCLLNWYWFSLIASKFITLIQSNK